MAEATIKKLTDKGFGFHSLPTGKDLFFHSSAVQGVSFDDLREGRKLRLPKVAGRRARALKM